MNAPSELLLNELQEAYLEEYIQFEEFTETVNKYFYRNAAVKPFVHSTKFRLKDPEHLKEKIVRKWKSDDPITRENFFRKITDLSGVRILLLKQSDFSAVHQAIVDRINKGNWYLNEKAIAYTWDPDTRRQFEDYNYFDVKEKPSYYTSVHYLVRPYGESPVCCEIQVRTLLEEVWGEVDHTINYPNACNDGSCRPQLLSLAKYVATGLQMVDTLFNSHDAHNLGAVDRKAPET